MAMTSLRGASLKDMSGPDPVGDGVDLCEVLFACLVMAVLALVVLGCPGYVVLSIVVEPTLPGWTIFPIGLVTATVLIFCK